MLNLKAPRATTLAGRAALALAATTNGGFETAAADGGHVADALLLAGLATVGAIARHRRA